jgi:GNAT superfamily N-acetyltransferase
VDIELREAVPADARVAADVLTAVDPERPTDPVVLRHEWDGGWSNWVTRRWLALARGAPVGYAELARPRWELVADRLASFRGDLLPDQRSEASLGTLLAEMERMAAADGARVLRARANEGDDIRIRAILARGYREDRRGKRWLLDLVAERERVVDMARASRERMRAEGVRLFTLDRDADPDRYVKVWRLSEEAAHDIPSSFGHVDESLEDFMRWLRSPDLREDHFWIARAGDAIVGCSVLAYPPERGIVTTEWTATLRSVRGRGIARALKCETLAQAIALGVDRVRTGNDAANAPILHINETMGYRPWVGAIDFTRSLG